MVEKTIKFRGKRIDNGKWVVGYLYQSEEESWITDSKNIHLSTHRNLAWWQVEPKTVGQYVGKLSNEDEVYISDLIQHGETIRIVEYRQGNTFLLNQNGKCTILLSFAENPKKLGNIFDNPELLINSKK
jgi:hypothetical protein